MTFDELRRAGEAYKTLQYADDYMAKYEDQIAECHGHIVRLKHQRAEAIAELEKLGMEVE